MFAVTDDETIAVARLDLGRRLAELRQDAGFSQRRFAPRVGYSRSELSRAELGLPHVSLEFWLRADKELDADGELVAEHERLQALEASLREQAHRQERVARKAPQAAGDSRPAASQSATASTAEISTSTIETSASTAEISDTVTCPHCGQPIALTTRLRVLAMHSWPRR